MNISKKIIVADGTTIPTAGQGNVTLNSSLPIQQVLDVPNLSNNLISVNQLTKVLNCCVIFSPHKCEFQAQDTRKMIGVVEECNRLHYLKKSSVFTKGEQPILACSSQPTLVTKM